MKHYPKEYEDVFTNPRNTDKCRILHVGTDIGLDRKQYQKLLRKTYKKFQKDFFDNLVKIRWLARRFSYFGYPRKKIRRNGMIDGAYGTFMRHYVGYDNRMFAGAKVFYKIASYLEDFFPNFQRRNPFKEKLKFPYKKITLEYLIVVYQMPERLELLDYAEKKKMKYTKFLDYIVNYINCHNDDVGWEEYLLNFNYVYVPYVRVIKKEKKYEETTIKKQEKT